MKYILFNVLIFIVSFAFSQPQAINYQGVARDSLGHALVNQNIGIRLSILDSINTGNALYVEIHSVNTNSSGLFNIYIGLGSVLSGNFVTIPWGKGDKWLKVEMNGSGGSNFQLVGVSQFLAVPYALHAATANILLNSSTSQTTFTMISNPNPTSSTFWQAINYCHNLNEGGYTDWRLPKYEEVEKYVELNGLPSSAFVTLCLNLLSIQTGAIHPLVVLNDVANSSGIGGGPNNTIPVATGNAYPQIRCVR